MNRRHLAWFALGMLIGAIVTFGPMLAIVLSQRSITITHRHAPPSVVDKYRHLVSD
jgi:hypothetical protein